MKALRVMLFLECSREWDRGLLQGITKYAQAHGPWNFYILPSSFIRCKVSALKNEIHRLKEWKADGMIAREVIPINDILSFKLPTIISSHTIKTVNTASNIVADNVQVGRLAAEHLLDRAFRSFAFCDYGDFFWSQERYEGFRYRLEEAGFNVDYYQWPTSKTMRMWLNERPIMVKWLKRLPKPVGIMACVDERSRDVNEACKIAGLRVPEDISIIGGDNDSFLCKLSDPPLSSVAIDTETAGYHAAQVLHKLMTKKIHDHQIIAALPTHVFCRASTDIIAVEDPDVVAAITFIRQNADKPIQVRDVVEHACAGRTILYNKFRSQIGHSIQEEIKKARIEKIVAMLVHSRSSIGQIANEMTMQPDNFSRYFASAKGMTPDAFRRKYQGTF